MSKKVAIVGTGPAGLMAAQAWVDAGYAVTVFEKRASYGRKILIAGSSGLNVTYDGAGKFWSSESEGVARLNAVTNEFGPDQWLSFIETRLGMKSFLGTSGRWLLEEKKSAHFLKKWIELLQSCSVRFVSHAEVVDFICDASRASGPVRIYVREMSASDVVLYEFDKVIFALGGASWLENQADTLSTPLGLAGQIWPSWCEMFHRKNIKLIPFEASNVGYEVHWPKELLAEMKTISESHNGRVPLKNIIVHGLAEGTEKSGDLLITEYGLEGTPLYHCGPDSAQLPCQIKIDLLPQWNEQKILNALITAKENLSVMRRLKRCLPLSEVALAVLFHCFHRGADLPQDLPVLAKFLKELPISLVRKRPLSEAISSGGGVAWGELDQRFQLKKYPGVYVIGEMVNWHAPTGGYLIQGCVSMAKWSVG